MHVLVVGFMSQMGVTRTCLSMFQVGRPLFLVRIILATTCRISPIPWGPSACELICFRDVWAFFVNCVRCGCKNPVRKDDAFY
jgi:hypothetical protein